ncbi:MAG: hypothetical protein HDR46_01065 [Bacteroides sp.]|nr:hypothetical protein [Bacteroides sp.]
MPTITLTVTKANVWNEVAKASGYTGSKMIDTDEKAYERILFTDEDQESLQRFWEEAVAVANDQLKDMLEAASPMNSDYTVTLYVSKSYDQVLNASVQAALTGYFISAIVGRWYKFSNKAEADSYISEASNMMDDVLRKLYSRKRPRRPNRERPPIGPLIPDTPILTDTNN